jgi:FAD/FMN-containing dehydrogenase
MVERPATLTDAQVAQLAKTFGGEIISPADAAYEDGRRLWNAVHDRRPALIVRPTDSAQVAIAIAFAREHDLELAVRAGGHSAPGHSSTNGGLVVDLSRMRGVQVDRDKRLARANGGALLGELDVAGQEHGLVCPVGVIGHTGVAGLTLGGGIGRLQRNFGLTIDNLWAVELVTADGRLVRASETEEPELFWGMRGAGWNFGIVTAFEFGLHPFGPDLHRGVRVYPAAAVRDAWDVFREYAEKAPDTVSMIFGISLSPDPMVVISFNHSGRAEDVERDTAPLRRGPKPTSATLVSQPYLEAQTAHDLVLGWGGRSFILGLYVDTVQPEALDRIVDLVASGPAGGSFSVTAQGGAISRTDDDAMAFTGRTARFDISADTSWDSADDDDANRDWVRRVMAVFEPDAIEGRYANELSDAGPGTTRAIYGDAKLGQLAQLKRIWDPDNIFHLNHNVPPAD